MGGGTCTVVVRTARRFLFLPVIGFLGTMNDFAVFAVMCRFRTMVFAKMRKSFLGFEGISSVMLLRRLLCQTLVF